MLEAVNKVLIHYLSSYMLSYKKQNARKLAELYVYNDSILPGQLLVQLAVGCLLCCFPVLL